MKRNELETCEAELKAAYDGAYERGATGVPRSDAFLFRFDNGAYWAARCGYADGRKAWIEQCQRIAAEIANPSNPDEVEP